ncbi:MAG: S-formylglutathione hydrolase [Pseudomonadota bacterium]
MKRISCSKTFGGTQAVYAHDSASTKTEMKFSVFTPPEDIHGKGPYPTLFWLSGLTCTEQNFIIKSGFQRYAAELGLMVIGPDTSPRGEGVPDDPEASYDFGLGAGFYCNATEEPWSQHYQMYDYVAKELPALVRQEAPCDPARTGVFGHSMGGHGALTVHLKNPDIFKTCSAFAPIVAPSQVPWGRKAFSNYLGADEAGWAEYDATALVAKQSSGADILIDQGTEDEWLAEQLKPELFTEAARGAGQNLTLRMQDGYDHSFFFVSTFLEDHLRWHKERL